MVIKKVIAGLLAGALLCSLAGCAGNAGPAKPVAEIRVVLDWTPNTNHTGMYVAQKLGYYKDAGLDVRIIQPPEDGALALVAAGKAEFCVDFQESIGPALTAESPLPVTAVAAVVSHNTSGIISRKSAGIASPRDLEGKRFAAWGTPLVDAIMRTVVEADGGDISKVEMLPNAVTDVVSALQADVDAVWVFEAWDAMAVQLSHVESTYIGFADLAPVFDFYTPVLAASDNYLAQNPEQAKAFMEATSRGYAYAAQNPDEAANILLEAAPELSEDLVVASQRLLAEKYRADAPYWGYIDEARWAAFYDWMYAEGLLEKPLGTGGFTNEYLPEYEG